MQFEKLQCICYEQGKSCFKLSLGSVILDRGLEFDGSKVSWVGRNLQSCVQVLLEACRVYEYTGVQGHYKPRQRAPILDTGPCQESSMFLSDTVPHGGEIPCHRTGKVGTAVQVWETRKLRQLAEGVWRLEGWKILFSGLEWVLKLRLSEPESWVLRVAVLLKHSPVAQYFQLLCFAGEEALCELFFFF